jgi:hypothetical protein
MKSVYSNDCGNDRYVNSYLQQERGRQSFRSRELRECNSSERKRPYSRVLYLVLFDTSEKVSLQNKIQNKQSSVTS